MKTNFLKTAIFFGLLFGAIMILEFLILNKLDVDGVKNPSLGIIINLLNYMVFPIAFVLLAVLGYKNKYNQGYVSFSEVLRIGAATTVMAAVVFSLFNLGYNYMFPEFIEQTINKMRDIALHQREQMLIQGATEADVTSIEDIEKHLEGTRKSMQSFFSIPVTIIMYAIVGIICSIVIAAFVKKDKPVEAEIVNPES